MKRINLNESQFERLFEGNIENYGQSNVPEFQTKDEVSITSKITNQDGETKDSVPPTTDKYSDQQTTQQWGNTNRRAFNTI